MHRRLALVVIAGCGRLGFDGLDGGGSAGLYIEAESMVVIPSMQITQDPTASGGAFVLDANPEGLSGPGTIRIEFSMPAAASYKIWFRARAADTATDSFFVSVDDEPVTNLCTGFSGHSAQWQWAPLNLDDAVQCMDMTPRVVALAQGAHTVAFESREGLSAVDRVLITADLGYVPVD